MVGSPRGLGRTVGNRVRFNILREFESRIHRVKTYVTRRIAVDAVQYTGDNADEVRYFIPDNRIRINDNGRLEAFLSEGWMEVKPGWWLYTDTVTKQLGMSSKKSFEWLFQEPTGEDRAWHGFEETV